MNIVFMGTPEFAVPSLEKLLNSNHKIAAVITVPDKPSGRGLSLKESDVKKYAAAHKLRILQPITLKDNYFITELNELSPELIVVVAFRILPPSVFNLPKFGSINLHASLLPKYRGAAPINWAILKGEKETGVTTFFLKDKVDTGNILLQEKIEINDSDNAGTLHDKLSLLGADVLIKTIDLIENTNGLPSVYVQDDNLFTPAPKITPEFCRIDWNNNSYDVRNFIRGLSPYPAAYTFLNYKRIKIYSADFSQHDDSSNPGNILIQSNRLYVKCCDKYLELTELQVEGKKRMNSSEFLNGYKSFISAGFN